MYVNVGDTEIVNIEVVPFMVRGGGRGGGRWRAVAAAAKLLWAQHGMAGAAVKAATTAVLCPNPSSLPHSPSTPAPTAWNLHHPPGKWVWVWCGGCGGGWGGGGAVRQLQRDRLEHEQHRRAGAGLLRPARPRLLAPPVPPPPRWGGVQACRVSVHSGRRSAWLRRGPPLSLLPGTNLLLHPHPKHRRCASTWCGSASRARKRSDTQRRRR